MSARRRGTRAVAACATVAALTVLAGCGSDPDPAGGPGSAPTTGAGSPPTSPTRTPATPSSTDPSPTAASETSRAPSVPPLDAPLLTPDVLVTSSRTIPAAVRREVAGVRGVAAAMPLSLAALSLEGRTLTVAAGDPARFRRFTPPESARADAVWSRVAGGEVAVDPALPRRLEARKGYLRLGTTRESPSVHIGAYAPMVGQISAFVDDSRAERLGLPASNALLVSTGSYTPSEVLGRLRAVLGRGVTFSTLAVEFDLDARATAVLSGASVSDAVGTFSYTPNADGTVTPDSRWVRAYIRRERVPILGEVTCNKGMLPQLRAALTEVQARGLADELDPGQYGGCYVPRFIARDPGKGLSMHSWGIAVDLNVPGNLRGTVGEMNREIVAIFKRWGFAWGGDWSYTDPMHFEMNRVVRTR